MALPFSGIAAGVGNPLDDAELVERRAGAAGRCG